MNGRRSSSVRSEFRLRPRIIGARAFSLTLIVALVALSSAQTDAAVPTRTFVPRFVAGTILALIAWSLEQADAPAPVELQRTYRALVGAALQGGAQA